MKGTTPDLIEELMKVGWFKEPHISILARADFRCEYCGQDLLATFNDCFNAQVDHICPKAEDGSELESNLAACCTTCNSLKWTYTPHGENRDERLADAAVHVQEQRRVQKVNWIKYRELMGR